MFILICGGVRGGRSRHGCGFPGYCGGGKQWARDSFSILWLIQMYLASSDKVQNFSQCCPIHEQVKKPLKNKSPSMQSATPENKSQCPIYISRLVCTTSVCGVMRKKLHCLSYVEWQILKDHILVKPHSFIWYEKLLLNTELFPLLFSHHTSSNSRKGDFRINHVSNFWTQVLESDWMRGNGSVYGRMELWASSSNAIMQFENIPEPIESY